MLLSFTKMHGLGNDFIVFEADDAHLPDATTLKKLANRHTGIGFDQALVIQAPRRDTTDVFYRIFNADGSEVEQCGNGARCVASLVAARANGAAPTQLHMDSPGGLVNAELRSDGLVSIDMGVPNFTPAALPFIADSQADSYFIEVGEEIHQIGAVSMGNPHAVLLVPDVNTAPVAQLGPPLESHPRFPRRVNVGFMQILSPEHIRLRVFERGVGETLACGTGACAAVAVGRQRGLLAETVQVDLPGGTLQIRWAGPGAKLWMTGPAITVYTGQINI
ncbi:MAG: diaminopimelate epimerase [Steroidobacteraceae bacterium]